MQKSGSIWDPAVFDTVIPRSVRLSEAPSYGLPIALYRPDSKGAEAYSALAAELRERDGKPEPVARSASSEGDAEGRRQPQGRRPELSLTPPPVERHTGLGRGLGALIPANQFLRRGAVEISDLADPRQPISTSPADRAAGSSVARRQHRHAWRPSARACHGGP